MIKIICSFIWDMAELLHIPLGKFAPYVFGGMIGGMPHRVKKEDSPAKEGE